MSSYSSCSIGNQPVHLLRNIPNGIWHHALKLFFEHTAASKDSRRAFFDTAKHTASRHWERELFRLMTRAWKKKYSTFSERIFSRDLQLELKSFGVFANLLLAYHVLDNGFTISVLTIIFFHFFLTNFYTQLQLFMLAHFLWMPYLLLSQLSFTVYPAITYFFSPRSQFIITRIASTQTVHIIHFTLYPQSVLFSSFLSNLQSFHELREQTSHKVKHKYLRQKLFLDRISFSCAILHLSKTMARLIYVWYT